MEAQVALAAVAQEPGELARVAVLVPLHHKVKAVQA